MWTTVNGRMAAETGNTYLSLERRHTTSKAQRQTWGFQPRRACSKRVQTTVITTDNLEWEYLALILPFPASRVVAITCQYFFSSFQPAVIVNPKLAIRLSMLC